MSSDNTSSENTSSENTSSENTSSNNTSSNNTSIYNTSHHLSALLCELLAGYDAVVDLPHALFHAELRSLCPDATILLTTRDVDSWTDSMANLLRIVQTVKQYRSCLRLFSSDLLDNFLVITDFMHNIAFPDTSDGGLREAYTRHNNIILNMYLGVRVVLLGDGWAPLCDILQTHIPKIPYPRLNSQASLLKRHVVRHVMWNVMNWYILPFLAVILALYLFS